MRKETKTELLTSLCVRSGHNLQPAVFEYNYEPPGLFNLFLVRRSDFVTLGVFDGQSR